MYKEKKHNKIRENGIWVNFTNLLLINFCEYQLFDESNIFLLKQMVEIFSFLDNMYKIKHNRSRMLIAHCIV